MFVAAYERSLQQSFKEIRIDVDFKVVELEVLYTAWLRVRPTKPGVITSTNRLCASDPLYAIVSVLFHSGQIATGLRQIGGGYNNPKDLTRLIVKPITFEYRQQDDLLSMLML